MKLGLLLGFWGEDGPPPRLLETVREAENLGYESVWTSEASGSDALTPLAWVGTHTATMRLGTSWRAGTGSPLTRPWGGPATTWRSSAACSYTAIRSNTGAATCLSPCRGAPGWAAPSSRW
jgi:hypothetical protein